MEDKVTKGGRTRRTTTAKAPATAVTKPAVSKPAATKPATTRPAAAPRKAAATPADVPATAGVPDRVELVRLAAYFHAERRGFAPGREVDDWLAAELEVSAKFGAAPAAPRGTPSRKPRQA